jgi:threonine/homoserine/homoserine lactone efflux protein
MASDFAAFLGIAAVVIVTPGQDMALVMRNALLRGRRSGILTALGVATGLATWAVATSLGLAALLVASEPLFVAIKLAGAAYLVVLGIQALRGALRPDPSPSTRGEDGSARPTAPSVAYRQGVISNLGNPKIAVFFTSLLPQFTPRDDASFVTLLPLGLVFCVLTLAWLTGYALAVARAGDVLRRPTIRRTLDGVMGAVLVALGLRLATAQR